MIFVLLAAILVWWGPTVRVISWGTALALASELVWGFNLGHLTLSWLAVVLLLILLRHFLSLPMVRDLSSPNNFLTMLSLGFMALIVESFVFGLLSWQVFSPELGFNLFDLARQPIWIWYTLAGLIFWSLVFQFIGKRYHHV